MSELILFYGSRINKTANISSWYNNNKTKTASQITKDNTVPLFNNATHVMVSLNICPTWIIFIHAYYQVLYYICVKSH